MLSKIYKNYSNQLQITAEYPEGSQCVRLLEEQFLLLQQAEGMWQNVWAGCARRPEHNSGEI